MPPTILVVDDNEMVRDVVAMMLNTVGYRALTAEDGATALAIFAGEPVEAAILDVDMPRMNGVDLCRALLAQAAASKRPLSAWLMTGLVRPDLMASAKAAGALGVLPKPFTKAELLACMSTVPGHAAQHALAS